jgi:hypothetical protein
MEMPIVSLGDKRAPLACPTLSYLRNGAAMTEEQLREVAEQSISALMAEDEQELRELNMRLAIFRISLERAQWRLIQRWIERGQ